MVTQQILVLLFQVRILVAQLKKDALAQSILFLYHGRNGVQIRRLPHCLGTILAGCRKRAVSGSFPPKSPPRNANRKSKSVSLIEKRAGYAHETRNKYAVLLQYTRNQNISKAHIFVMRLDFSP